MRGARIAVGDRVVFMRGHPWYGRSGTVIEPMTTPVSEGWSVEVDGQAGVCSFATETEVVVTESSYLSASETSDED